MSQQEYYAALIPQLAKPFRDFPWEFSGFNKRADQIVSDYARVTQDDELVHECHIICDSQGLTLQTVLSDGVATVRQTLHFPLD